MYIIKVKNNDLYVEDNSLRHLILTYYKEDSFKFYDNESAEKVLREIMLWNDVKIEFEIIKID